jgi:NADH-quinone oxidoreductase subunit E
MARLSAENVALARQVIARYPRARSALIPLLHIAQEQDGWVGEVAMEHIAELIGITAAEVLGTCSFYEMFKLEPVGRYLVNVCTSISCHLLGGDDLLEQCAAAIGVKPGATTADGMFTLQRVECIAACTEAPCLQVNYRYFTNLRGDAAERLVGDLRAGRLAAEVPDHGTLTRVRQQVAPDRWAGTGAVGLPSVPGGRREGMGSAG